MLDDYGCLAGQGRSKDSAFDNQGGAALIGDSHLHQRMAFLRVSMGSGYQRYSKVTGQAHRISYFQYLLAMSGISRKE